MSKVSALLRANMEPNEFQQHAAQCLKENLPLRESFDSAKVHLTEKIKRLLLLVLFYDLQLLKCTVEKKVQRICIRPVEKHKTRLMESGSSTAKLISSISPFQMRLRKVESC